MVDPFRFEGRIGRLPYAVWSAGAFLTQHVIIFLVSGRIPELGWSFQAALLSWFADFDSARGTAALPAFVLFCLLVAAWITAAWVLAACTFRRAVDANVLGSVAVLAVVPFVQIPVILFLSVAPSSPAVDTPPPRDPVMAETAWRTAVEGVAAGIGLTLVAVVIGALVFRVYGAGLFLISPLVIGATTAYLANRRGDIGGRRTRLVVLGAIGLGGAALLAVALEGLVCLVLAAPLAIGAAVLGGLLGRSIALANRRSTRNTLSGLALMPLIFAAEAVTPPVASFETRQAIDIGAPPKAVWNAIVHMTPLDEPVALPFRLGLAYPVSGEIVGEGVGAVRRGFFSTGIASERITEWVPNRKLTFVVESDPPSMDEVSPYQHVFAPHVLGYFHTRSTAFELSAAADGHTLLIERTAHELRLDPVLYWLPMAQWVVGENNARVLVHIKREAERAFRAVPATGLR